LFIAALAYLDPIYTLTETHVQNLGNGVMVPRNGQSQKGGSALLEFAFLFGDGREGEAIPRPSVQPRFPCL
jgi:hypothetical protein